tara:strand:- start:238 stop:462 length:225 start_codon:yes stop_codon:yes gene_type:complete
MKGYKTMDNIIHNTITVQYGTRPEEDQYCLYWQGEHGTNSEFICYVYGFENALKVANGIAHEQVDYVKHPGFNI